MKTRRLGKRAYTYYLDNKVIVAAKVMAKADTRVAKAKNLPPVAESHLIARLVLDEKERRKNAEPVEVNP